MPKCCTQKQGKLPPRQEQLCQEYLVDLNIREAGRRAGYKCDYRNIWTLFKRKEVQERIQELMEERNKRTQISQDYVLNSLKNVADRCMDEENFQPQAANKSLELLGKHLGMFTEKHEHTGKDGGTINLAIVAKALDQEEENG